MSLACLAKGEKESFNFTTNIAGTHILELNKRQESRILYIVSLESS